MQTANIILQKIDLTGYCPFVINAISTDRHRDLDI